ncbi:hypothetical protein JJB11_18690 [Ramlibacter ginsenosidimutans]|uniref:Uncharacterized protein n=1 Tax=Ramlibacter ginsenosidimutans TaxID=502333 RepID=A0A934WP12_9BURK|nr:hypothetical protein [Ramlibacter ginsenosidimutans]MBK6008135.1 hypothetical protein [Ramlibacter ginsenosidimutans]
MAQDDDTRTTTTQPFTLYAAKGRVYARNRDQKIVDLGTLTRGDDGWSYLLDGNQQSAGGFSSDEQALRDLGRNLRFLWLDGQFTAVADAKDDATLALDGATRLDIELDELPPGGRMQDATV